MIKLARNIFLLAIIVIMALVTMVILTPADPNNYFAAAKDKHHMLYEIKSPRIILVGGSNVAFSIDGQRLERSVQMPVINTGLHVGLGLRFMLDEVRAALKDGDIVILFLEYELFFDSLDGNPKFLGTAVKSCPECMLSADSPHQIFNFGIGLLQTMEGELTRNIRNDSTTNLIYSRQSFDSHGDMVRQLEYIRVSDFRKRLVLPANINDLLLRSPAIELLNSFSESCRASNARVFLMFPGIFVRDFNSQEEKFTDLYRALKEKLEIPILGQPQDFIYPYRMFYDSFYHLNHEGRNLHTNRIIQLLDLALEN